LNPVASVVLTGTITLPLRFGEQLPPLIAAYGKRWTARIQDKLEPYFPLADDDISILGYIWAHAIPCPETGFATPLIPNSWLSNADGKKVAIEITGDPASGAISRRLVVGDEAEAVGPTGTYKGGKATSIFTGQVIEASQIQEQAQGGRLTEILLAIVITRPGTKGRSYRLPAQADLDAVEAAAEAYREQEISLELDQLLPTEEIPRGKETKRCWDMGITTWRAMFTPRQLLAHTTAMRAALEVVSEAAAQDGPEIAAAVNLLRYRLTRAATTTVGSRVGTHPARLSATRSIGTTLLSSRPSRSSMVRELSTHGRSVRYMMPFAAS
jgi:adenine-specific DNA methylase